MSVAALTLFFFCSLHRALIRHLPSSQIESMMLTLQRLQQKAALDDDYDAGERRPRADGPALSYGSCSLQFSAFLFLCVFVYVIAERFGKKMEELSGERRALKPGLPSTQPSVAQFLQRLRQAVDSALQRPDCALRRSVQP